MIIIRFQSSVLSGLFNTNSLAEYIEKLVASTEEIVSLWSKKVHKKYLHAMINPRCPQHWQVVSCERPENDVYIQCVYIYIYIYIYEEQYAGISRCMYYELFINASVMSCSLSGRGSSLSQCQRDIMKNVNQTTQFCLQAKGFIPPRLALYRRQQCVGEISFGLLGLWSRVDCHCCVVFFSVSLSMWCRKWLSLTHVCWVEANNECQWEPSGRCIDCVNWLCSRP